MAIGDIHLERGEQVREELLVAGASEALFLDCDVTRGEDLERACRVLEENWGGLDVLVNNAGVALAGKVEEFSLEDWGWAIDVNLLGVVRGCRTFVPLFRGQKHGHIVNIASMAALADFPFVGPYGVTKAGVVKLTETMHQELRAFGIEVSVVCPYFLNTNLLESLRTPDSKFRKMASRSFSSARLTPERLADIIFANFANPQLFVLPTYRERVSWWLKRYLPRGFYTYGVRRLARWFS